MPARTGETRIQCWLCAQVQSEHIALLHRYFRNVREWPAEWSAKVLERPGNEGVQRDAMTRVGQAWLAEHGYPQFSLAQVSRHLAHVVSRAIERQEMSTPTVNGPEALAAFYLDMLGIGRKAMAELKRRLTANPELEIETMTTPELLKLVDMSSRAASVAAGARARSGGGGVLPDAPELPDPDAEPDDGGGGFMGSAAARPSKRMGHHRARVIEGEVRIVADEGPKDREHYGERSFQEGGPRLQ